MKDTPDICLSESERIQRLVDKDEIRALIGRYARAVLHGDAHGLSELFIQEGRFVVFKGSNDPAVDIMGQERIRDQHQSLAPFTTIPIITNLIIDVAADEASGSCLMFCLKNSAGEKTSFFGEYADIFIKTKGNWRFRERRFSYLST